MKKWFIHVFIMLLPYMVLAQMDTTFILEEVQVLGIPASKYATDRRVEKIDIKDISSSLDEALENVNSVYFRTYGNHQLASISFRGTSASHTNVLWHGIPVNSPALGQTDFSTWPVWLLDNLAAQAGSAGALYGSGSIGGTVFIDSFTEDSDERAVVKLGAGSFGHLFTGAKLNAKLGKLKSSTSFLRSFIENDFSFTKSSLGEERVQDNAAVLNYGIKQTLSYRWNNQKLVLDGMFTLNDREVQPAVTNLNNSDQLYTQNVRMALDYAADLKSVSLKATLGYVNNYFDYNEGIINASNTYSLLTEADWFSSTTFSLRGGYLAQYTTAISDNFDDGLDQLQNDLFLNGRWDPDPSISVFASARYSQVDAISAPLLPSLGTSYRFWRKRNEKVKLTANYSRGYKFPTLNDLYWTPGGNEDLVPESSHSLDAGLYYEKIDSNKSLSVGMNAFQIWSENWIVWIPGDNAIWSPQNVRNVSASGLEFDASYRKTFHDYGLAISANSTYNLTSIVEDDFNASYRGNQLAYTPKWLADLSVDLTYKKWKFSVDQSYTGARYTNLDNRESQKINAFYLLDMELGRKWNLLDFAGMVNLEIANLLDVYYENIINRAMPGTNYTLELLIKLK